MKKVIQVSICCFWLIFLGCNSEQKEVTKEAVKKEYKHFLSIEDVKARIEAKESIRIIEISKSAKYQEKHLPNAIHLWRPDYENSTDYDYGGMAASKLQMEQMLGNKGISSNDTIVLYDTKGSCDAIRLLWILTMYGHENAYIMDGGKVAWEQAGFPFTEVIPKLDTTAYEFRGAIQNDNYATIEEVKAAIHDTNVVLLDTRELYEFKGEPYLSKSEIMPYKKGAFTYGCIPTAVHLFPFR